MGKVEFLYPFVAICCLIIGLENTEASLSLLAAMAIHELGHIAVIRFSGGKMCKTGIYGVGAQIGFSSKHLSRHGEIAVFAAGPCAGAIGALVGSILGLELFAKASLCLTLLNMLPAMPFDGGCILRTFLPYGKEEKILYVSGLVTGGILSLLGLYAVFKGGNFSFLASGVCVFLYSARKTPLQ